jgi:hypothetical protein
MLLQSLSSGLCCHTDVISELPISLKTVKINLNKPNPQIGTSMMEWSADGRFLLTKDDNMPNVLWVWETIVLQLKAVLIQIDAIKCAKWDPVHSRLALCTGNGRLYMWSVDGASCVEVPAGSCLPTIETSSQREANRILTLFFSASVHIVTVNFHV